MKRLLLTAGLVLALAGFLSGEARADGGFNFGFHARVGNWCGQSWGYYYATHPCGVWNPYGFPPYAFPGVVPEATGGDHVPSYYSDPLNDWTNYYPHGLPGHGYGFEHGYGGYGWPGH